MRKVNYSKLFAESFLIIFSVLFALLIGRISDEYRAKKQATHVLENIDLEITNNHVALKRWFKIHTLLQGRVDSIANGQIPEVKEKLLETDFLGLSILLNGDSFIDALIYETAWEVAKSTKLLSEMDYKDVKELTFIYGVQDLVVNQSLPNIINELFSRESQNLDNLSATLNQLKLHLSDLISQETLLIRLYENRLNSK